MEPEQSHECACDAEEVLSIEEVSPGYPFIRHIAKLMGKTAGLAQSAGVKTASGLRAARGPAGKLLSVPAKVRSFVAHKTGPKRPAGLSRASEDLQSRIHELHTRIGTAVCDSPQLDRFLLAADPQLEALISAVQDLEAKKRAHEQRVPGGPPLAATSARGASVCTTEHAGACSEDAQAGAGAPSSAGATRQEPLAGPA